MSVSVRLFLAACVLLLSSAVLASPAHALLPGKYAMHRSCSIDGSDAYVNSEGWSSISGFAGAALEDGCIVSDPLVVGIGTANDLTPGQASGWVYTAPADTQMGIITVRSKTTYARLPEPGEARAVLRIYRQERIADGAHLLLDCAVEAWSTCSGTSPFLTFAAMADADRVFVMLECVGEPGDVCPAETKPEVTIGGFTTQLMDGLAPTGSFTGGTLLSDEPRWGTQTLTFDAADRGLGVRLARVRIGETVISDWAAVRNEGSRCTPVQDDGTLAKWLWPVPCPLLAQQILRTVNVSSVAPGEHLLTLELRDAAGNDETVDARMITIGEPAARTPSPPLSESPAPEPEPAPSGSSVPGEPARLTAPSGGLDPVGVRIATSVPSERVVARGRPFTISGRLLSGAGAGVAGAKVAVSTRLRVAGAGGELLAAATTDAAGRFSVTARADGSREYVLAYVGPSGALLATTTLAVSVPAKLQFKAPRRVQRQRPARFAGRLVADHLPASGVAVRIEARFDRRWQRVATVRTDARGHFVWRHRFRHRGGFRMRATLPATPQLPAAPGSSKPVRFRVR